MKQDMKSMVARTMTVQFLFHILLGLYILFYLLNKKTPKPEGCESLEENCEGCQITSCSNRKEKKEEENI